MKVAEVATGSAHADAGRSRRPRKLVSSVITVLVCTAFILPEPVASATSRTKGLGASLVAYVNSLGIRHASLSPVTEAPGGPVAVFAYCPDASYICQGPRAVVARYVGKPRWSTLATLNQFPAMLEPEILTAGQGSIIGSLQPVFHISWDCSSLCPFVSSLIGDSAHGWQALRFHTRWTAGAGGSTSSDGGPLALVGGRVVGLDNTCSEAAASVCAIAFPYRWDRTTQEFVGSAPLSLEFNGKGLYGAVGTKSIMAPLYDPKAVVVRAITQSLDWQPTMRSGFICGVLGPGGNSPDAPVELAEWGDLTAVFSVPSPGEPSNFAAFVYDYGGWTKSSWAGSTPTIPLGHPLPNPVLRLLSYAGTPFSIGDTVSELRRWDPSASVGRAAAGSVFGDVTNSSGVAFGYSSRGVATSSDRISEVIVNGANC